MIGFCWLKNNVRNNFLSVLAALPELQFFFPTTYFFSLGLLGLLGLMLAQQLKFSF